ncbi:MAG TPA: tetratricopeptide repeat protein [Pontiella sp.]
MNKLFLSIACTVVFFVASAVESAPIKAELFMPGGRSWKGSLIGRDGDWIEFSTGAGARPIRVGAGTIESLAFEVNIDSEKLSEMNSNREYQQIIDILDATLSRFADYSDISSNLTPYNSFLMELNYKVGNYKESLTTAKKLAQDDSTPDFQETGRIYLTLSLIGIGNIVEAEKVMHSFGWNAATLNASPATLYITAKILEAKKEYQKAIELAARIVALHSHSPEWMQPAELLCAELYTKLGKYDSAEEVINQIFMLYRDSDEDVAARKLKRQIATLRSQQETLNAD